MGKWLYRLAVKFRLRHDIEGIYRRRMLRSMARSAAIAGQTMALTMTSGFSRAAKAGAQFADAFNRLQATTNQNQRANALPNKEVSDV